MRPGHADHDPRGAQPPARPSCRATQTDFGANHWIDVGGDNTVFKACT